MQLAALSLSLQHFSQHFIILKCDKRHRTAAIPWDLHKNRKHLSKLFQQTKLEIVKLHQNDNSLWDCVRNNNLHPTMHSPPHAGLGRGYGYW